MVENLHVVKELGFSTRRALEAGNVAEFGRLMNVHWQHKKRRSAGMSNPKINEWYDSALCNGALGGKLIGAGGGGFLMFYAEDKTRLRHAMREQGLKEVRFRFECEGTRVISYAVFCLKKKKSDSIRWICNSTATADITYSASAIRCCTQSIPLA